MNILLIDDDPLFSQEVCTRLYSVGNTVEYSESFASALGYIDGNTFDLYIIDLMLPPTYSDEGIQLLKMITKESSRSQVLMISSKDSGMTVLVDQAYQCGAKRFLDKSDASFFKSLLLVVQEVRKEMSNSIFISHGHAELLKYQLKDFLENKLKREVVILSEQPNKGLTVVEKLELASERCDKAIILLTKDDEMADGNKRGRQNVIHEIGFFQGKYGRNNVVLLCEKGVELFSNISGIVYIHFDREHFSEVFESLREELQ